jgi:hypothetical protein
MAKHLLTGCSGKALEEVVQDFSEYLELRPWIERCGVHVRRDLQESTKLGPLDPNVAAEIWTNEEPTDWEAEIAAAPLSRVSGYQLEEVIEKGDPVYPRGQIEGITLVALIWPARGVPISEVRSRYARHAPLAQRVLIGMDRYSRHWIDRISTPGATAWCGVSVLHFPTAEAYLERRYESPEGRAAIKYDLSGFAEPARTLSFSARSYALR